MMAPVAFPVHPPSYSSSFSSAKSSIAFTKPSSPTIPRLVPPVNEAVASATFNGSETSTASETMFTFDSMDEALQAFARGEFLVVMDDESRENEGDLIIAADKITTEKMAWFIKYTSGYICISLPQDRLDELEIPMMVPTNTERHRTAYTVTVDYKHGTSTGISAHDRALTARMLCHPSSKPEDFSRPGHMVPLRARPGGVIERKGHTEAAIDLCRLAGLRPAGLLCELVNDDLQGSMARRDDCRAFANKWGLKMISVEMISEWRKAHELQSDAV